jgi:hypothetical protein
VSDSFVQRDGELAEQEGINWRFLLEQARLIQIRYFLSPNGYKGTQVKGRFLPSRDGTVIHVGDRRNERVSERGDSWKCDNLKA